MDKVDQEINKAIKKIKLRSRTFWRNRIIYLPNKMLNKLKVSKDYLNKYRNGLLRRMRNIGLKIHQYAQRKHVGKIKNYTKNICTSVKNFMELVKVIH